MRESILLDTLASMQYFCSFLHDVRTLNGEMHLFSNSNERQIGTCMTFVRVSHLVLLSYSDTC